jgi:hypothetical protein
VSAFSGIDRCQDPFTARSAVEHVLLDEVTSLITYSCHNQVRNNYPWSSYERTVSLDRSASMFTRHKAVIAFAKMMRDCATVGSSAQDDIAQAISKR